MLKEQILKEAKPTTRASFAFFLLIMISGIILAVWVASINIRNASDLAAVQSLTLLDLFRPISDELYLGSSLKALELLWTGLMQCFVALVLFFMLSIGSFLIWKNNKVYKLVQQLPDTEDRVDEPPTAS